MTNKIKEKCRQINDDLCEFIRGESIDTNIYGGIITFKRETEIELIELNVCLSTAYENDFDLDHFTINEMYPIAHVIYSVKTKKYRSRWFGEDSIKYVFDDGFHLYREELESDEFNELNSITIKLLEDNIKRQQAEVINREKIKKIERDMHKENYLTRFSKKLHETK